MRRVEPRAHHAEVAVLQRNLQQVVRRLRLGVCVGRLAHGGRKEVGGVALEVALQDDRLAPRDREHGLLVDVGAVVEQRRLDGEGQVVVGVGVRVEVVEGQLLGRVGAGLLAQMFDLRQPPRARRHV